MTQMYGADPAQLDELGNRFNAAAQSLDVMCSEITGQLHHTTWCGTDADEIRHDWDTSYRNMALVTAEGMRELARLVHQNALEQQRASSADGPGGDVPSTVVPGQDPGGKNDDWGWVGDALLGTFKVAVGGADLAFDLGILKAPASLLGKIGVGSLGAFGVIDDLSDLYFGLRDGDVGQTAFAVVGLGLMAAGLVATGPWVVGGLLVAGFVVGVASEIDPVKNWVGDRLTDGWNATTGAVGGMMEAGGQVLYDLSRPFHGPLSPPTQMLTSIAEGASDMVGSVGDSVGDFASQGLDNGKKFFTGLFGG